MHRTGFCRRLGAFGNHRARGGAARHGQKLDPKGTAHPSKVSSIMIPENPDDLYALAGEYVLGVLDEAEASEVEGALDSNIELRRAVTFWEEQLHPLSKLAGPADPPPGAWEAIEARIARPALR